MPYVTNGEPIGRDEMATRKTPPTFREKLQSVIQEYKAEASLEDELWRINREPPVDDQAALEDIEGLSIQLSNLEDGLRANDYSLIEETANRYINSDFRTLRRGSPEHAIVLREFSKADIELAKLAIRRCRGDYSGDDLIAQLPDHTNSLKLGDTQETSVGKPGRPGWIDERVRPELQRRIDAGEIDTGKQTQIGLCRELAQWHNSKHKQPIKAASIRKALADMLPPLFSKKRIK